MQVEEPVVRTLKSAYKKREALGSGSFGMVSKGVSRSDPTKIVAIKEVDRRKFEKDHLEILTKTLERQILFNNKLKEAECPFITQNIVYFIFEYCQKTLAEMISQILDSSFLAKREYILIKVLYQMLLTLKVLKNMNLIHRDIKPENILIEKGMAKLGDFGFCRQLNQNLTSGRGSLRTTAPQSHTSTFYNKCDIWSLGVTIHNCLYGIEPFEQALNKIKDPLHFRQIIMSKQFKVKIQKGSKISDILEKMIVIQESQRANVEQLLSHPLFQIQKLSTPSQWIRGWLIFSSILTFQKKQFDSTILAIVSVAFTTCIVYYQCHKNKTDKNYFFHLTYLLLQLFVKMLSQMNSFSHQNLQFIEKINIYFPQQMIQRQIRIIKASSSLKSFGNSIQKLYKFILSGADITTKLVQLKNICESNNQQQVKSIINSKYPDFVIFPTLNKLLSISDKLKWGLNNIILLANKQPLSQPKFFFEQNQLYHENISIF